MKKAHLLRGNKGNKIYSRLIFFDTETTNVQVSVDEQHAFFKLAVICVVDLNDNFEEWYTAYTIRQFWEYILKYCNENTLIFAHNMHFDLNVVHGLIELAGYGFELTNPVFESSVFLLSARRREKRLVFLDTFNFFKTSLKQIGKTLGIEKLTIDFDKCSIEELEIYCKRDVLIIKKIILKWIEFIQQHDLGNMKFTIASQSFTAFQHKFMEHEIYIHDNLSATQLEQKSYRGGRTEAFKLGNVGKCALLDVNSLYPFVMANLPYPSKLLSIKENLSKTDIQYLLESGYSLIADCTISLTEPAIGLKYKLDSGTKLIFPVGKFQVPLTSPELRYCLQFQKIHKFHKVCIYESNYIFKHFVNELYNLRLEYQQEKNYVFEQMVKMILNSLYGKFGQKKKHLECIGSAPKELVLYERCIDVDTGKTFTQIIFGGKVWINQTTGEESFNSFTAIASHVTAYARMYMFYLFQILDTVFYCDTDSLIIPIKELPKLKNLIQSGLGFLKLEDSEEECCIFNAKDYIFGDKIKKKGIKRTAIKIDEDTFQQEQFLKTKSLIRKGKADRVIIRKVIKHCKSHYDKGLVQDSGIVLPYTLPF